MNNEVHMDPGWSEEVRQSVQATFEGRRQAVDFALIRRVCQEIAEEFHPQKIVVFGSYAHGTPTADSDVDILVIMPFAGSPHQHSIAIRRFVNRQGSRFPMDLLVRTPEFISERLANDDWFLRGIMQEGILVYEAPDRGVDKQGMT